MQYSYNSYKMEEQRIEIKPVSAEEQKNPEFDRARDGCFLARWLSIHTFVNLFRSLVRPLSRHDLLNLTPDIHPESNLHHFKQAQQAIPNQKNDIIKTLFYRVLLSDFLWTGFLSIVAAGLGFAGPFVIEKIMEFLNNPHATTVQQNIAYGYAGIWIGLYLVRIFVFQYCQRMLTYTSIKAEQVLTVQILSKISRLAPSYKFQEQKDRGFLLGYLTTEVQGVTAFFGSSAVLFFAPATLIAVQVLLFIKVGRFAFVLIVLLVISGLVQVILYFKILKTTGKKLAVMGKRGLSNLQFYYGIENIKLFGWEDMVIDRNMKLREIQNKYNRLGEIYINIFQLVINLVPIITVFLIFILLLIIDGQKQLDTTLVYTILSLVGLTYDPTKLLLKSITAALAGTASMKKISEFMDAPEVSKNQIKDNSIEQGLVIINNLLASWQTASVKTESESSATMTQNLNNTIQAQLIERDELDDHREHPLPNIDSKTGKMKALSIPHEIQIKKGDRIILLSKPQAGKSTFFQTLIGNLHIISGVAKYGGTVGYLPQVLWFRKTSVRDNVLFGEAYDRKKLQFVYKMVGLKEQLGFFRNGQKTIMEQNNGMSQGQRRRIALARVLYANPDLLLLDEVFSSLDLETTKYIYKNLCQNYGDKTIIMSTHATHFIKPEDKILLLKEGTVINFGTSEEILKNKDDILSKADTTSLLSRYEEESTVSREFIQARQIYQKRERMSELRNKLRNFVRNLVAIAKGLSKQQINQKIFEQAKKRQKQRAIESKSAKRIRGVPLAIYKMLFKSAPLSLYLLLFFLSMLTEGVRVFSNWWIGSVNNFPWTIDATLALVIYMVLTLAYGILELTTGIVSPHVSVITARTINQQLCRALTYANFKWHVDNNCAKVAQKANRDNNEYFVLNETISSMVRSILTFVATVILVGINAPLFFLLAALVILIDVLVLIAYMRAIRELYEFKDEFKDALFLTFEQTINGIDLLRAFGKTSNPRSAAIKQIYNSSVFKINLKFVDQGMSIITEIVSLGIIAGAAFFAVASKLDNSKTDDDIAIIGTSIAFAMQITGIVGSIIWNVAEIEGLLSDNLVAADQLIGKNQQNSYYEPSKPADWPKNGEIDFEQVTLRYPGYIDPSIKDIRLHIKSGQRVYIAGRSGSGKGSLLKAVTKYLEPVKNLDRTLGVLKISGVDIQKIGRLYITQNIVVLNPVPFIFTATLRENLDPFGIHPDTEIRNYLQTIGAWEMLLIGEQQQPKDKLTETQNILDQVVYDGGRNFSLGLVQLFNITRALLAKPKVIVWDTAGSSLSDTLEKKQLQVIRNTLKDTTLLIISQKITTAMICDRAIYMREGRIKEIGKPKKMIRNKDSAFAKLMQNDQLSSQLQKIIDEQDEDNSQ